MIWLSWAAEVFRESNGSGEGVGCTAGASMVRMYGPTVRIGSFMAVTICHDNVNKFLKLCFFVKTFAIPLSVLSPPHPHGQLWQSDSSAA